LSPNPLKKKSPNFPEPPRFLQKPTLPPHLVLRKFFTLENTPPSLPSPLPPPQPLPPPGSHFPPLAPSLGTRMFKWWVSPFSSCCSNSPASIVLSCPRQAPALFGEKLFFLPPRDRRFWLAPFFASLFSFDKMGDRFLFLGVSTRKVIFFFSYVCKVSFFFF